MKFKVGDKVKIRCNRRKQTACQSIMTGTIVEVKMFLKQPYAAIKFPDYKFLYAIYFHSIRKSY